MFFSVASPDWKPGQPLAPVGALLFWSRSEAEAFAPDASVVAVLVRYHSATRAVIPQGRASAAVGQWTSRAVSNILGGITVFGSIPSDLIRALGGSDLKTEVRSTPGVDQLQGEFHGWDSLTMALLA